MTNLQAIISHQAALKQCRSCPDMLGPVVVGHPVISSVMLIGQAPGDKEGAAGKPFAWTAGKTLFRWFEQIGKTFTIELAGSPVDLIPLPHPSGASTWHRTEPGKGLLQSALSQIESHPAWRHLCPV